MKKLGLVLLLLVSTSAFAFGGGGGRNNRTHEWYKHGVDAIGVHIGGDTCTDDQELIDGKCLKKCGEGLERNTDNTCTICTNGNVYLSYMDNPCETETIFDGCKSNKDCDSGKYCKLTQKSSSNYVPGAGACEPLYSSTIFTYNNKSFLISTTQFTWWSAENWCRAHNLHLAVPQDIISDSEALALLASQGYCYETECKLDWAQFPEDAYSPRIFWLNSPYKQQPSWNFPTQQFIVPYEQEIYNDSLEYWFYALCTN